MYTPDNYDMWEAHERAQARRNRFWADYYEDFPVAEDDEQEEEDE